MAAAQNVSLKWKIIIISLMAINLYFLINPMLAQTNSTSPVRNSKKSMHSIFLTVNYVICLSDISRQLSKNNSMISHYMLEYGYVPLWVLVNTLTLGTISTFYSYLTQKDQNDIGRHFMLKPEEMNSFLQVLTIYRNACAHDERLYNLKALRRSMKPNSISTLPIHKRMNIPFNSSNNPIYGKNDLFAIIIIFKTMLPKSSFNKFFSSLKKLIKSLDGNIHAISIEIVLYKMGFPSNWKDIQSI